MIDNQRVLHFSHKLLNMVWGSWCQHYLLRNALPKALSLRKGFFGSTTRAFPGITPSCSPCITAMNESVVGSGPIRIPGKSCSMRCRIKVVFPVEYWPTRRTMGLLSKSASSRAGEWKSWNRYVSSRGNNLVRYSRRSPSETFWNSSGSFFKFFLNMATGFFLVDTDVSQSPL